MATQRPPLAQRKGITVTAPSSHPPCDSLRSARSCSRSRGVSISRATGICIDKIYEPKHFPQPAKDPALSECQSLKLVSAASERSLGEGEVVGVRVVGEGERRSGSPITKLVFGEEGARNLVRF
jgi:hypothetical protein